MKKNCRILYCFKKKHFFTFNPKGPNEFLYGLDSVSKLLPTSTLFANNYHTSLWLKNIEKILAQLSGVGCHFQIYLNNKDKFSKYDILFAVEDGVSFGLLFYKFSKHSNNKTIVLIQGLHDRFERSFWFKRNKLLTFFYHCLLNQADYILTLSDYEKKLLAKSFYLPLKKIRVFYFGTDIEFWNKNHISKLKKAKEFTLTIGNDMHRDYDLLINNYPLEIPLKLVTSKLNKTQLDKIKNLPVFEQYQDLSNEKLRQLYYQAKFIIIPLQHTYATSGLSTILQALAMEKPVLVADAPALKELFTDYQHVIYYKTGNASSLETKLKELNNNQKLRLRLANNGRKLVEEKFNSQNMGKNILRLSQTLINS